MAMAKMPPRRKASTSRQNNDNHVSVTTGRRNRPTKYSDGVTSKTLQKPTSISEMFSNLVLSNNENKENDLFCLDEFQGKPDLWMAAFDNPIDFIQYCRKRLDHERKLMDRSRQVENDIVQLLERLEKNSSRHAEILQDLFKVQSINDKLQQIIMEERTHCQHLIGENDELETQRKIMARKYQAALVLGKVDEKSVEHLLEKDPKVVHLADQASDLREKIKKCDSKSRTKPPCTDPVILADKVRRLEDYIRDLKKQHREEVTVLKDTIEKYDLKCEAMAIQYDDLLKRDAKQLKDVKESLSNLSTENLHLRNELLQKDQKFLQVQIDEIQAATRKRPSRHTKSVDEITEAFEECTSIEKDLKLRLAQSEIELVEKSNILQDAMTKIIMLERKCSNLEQENMFLNKSHESCVSILKSRNEVLEKRCDKTDERRRLDNAGFREDIRQLRQLLKTVNKNVQKMKRANEEAQMESESFERKISDRELEAILHKKNSKDSFKNWLKNANPKKTQQAVSIWSDFLGRKLNDLEDRLTAQGSKSQAQDLVVLYDNKVRMKRSTESAKSNDTHDMDSSDYNDLPSATN